MKIAIILLALAVVGCTNATDQRAAQCAELRQKLVALDSKVDVALSHVTPDERASLITMDANAHHLVSETGCEQ